MAVEFFSNFYIVADQLNFNINTWRNTYLCEIWESCHQKESRCVSYLTVMWIHFNLDSEKAVPLKKMGRLFCCVKLSKFSQGYMISFVVQPDGQLSTTSELFAQSPQISLPMEKRENWGRREDGSRALGSYKNYLLRQKRKRSITNDYLSIYYVFSKEVMHNTIVHHPLAGGQHLPKRQLCPPLPP